MKKLFFIKNFFLTAILAFIALECIAQNNEHTNTDKQSFYFYYSASGLSLGEGYANMIEVKGNKIIHTTQEYANAWQRAAAKEINNNKIDTISVGTFHQSSIDSILSLVLPLKDSTIFKSNPCYMGGTLYTLIISNGRDTTKFSLGNTFDYTALKISAIVNQYLSADEKITATEELIKEEANCYKQLFQQPSRKKIKASNKSKHRSVSQSGAGLYSRGRCPHRTQIALYQSPKSELPKHLQC